MNSLSIKTFSNILFNKRVEAGVERMLAIWPGPGERRVPGTACVLTCVCVCTCAILAKRMCLFVSALERLCTRACAFGRTDSDRLASDSDRLGSTRIDSDRLGQTSGPACSPSSPPPPLPCAHLISSGRARHQVPSRPHPLGERRLRKKWRRRRGSSGGLARGARRGPAPSAPGGPSAGRSSWRLS